ncbi:7003_t:CDS:2, partial [Racocetra persica]
MVVGKSGKYPENIGLSIRNVKQLEVKVKNNRALTSRKQDNPRIALKPGPNLPRRLSAFQLRVNCWIYSDCLSPNPRIPEKLETAKFITCYFIG